MPLTLFSLQTYSGKYLCLKITLSEEDVSRLSPICIKRFVLFRVFFRCICGLLKKKPRILVTHQLQYLKAADEIVVLKEVLVCVSS